MSAKLCYCETCDRRFHSLGIARHRAMHRDRKELCVIQYSNGDWYEYHFHVKPVLIDDATGERR